MPEEFIGGPVREKKTGIAGLSFLCPRGAYGWLKPAYLYYRDRFFVRRNVLPLSNYAP